MKHAKRLLALIAMIVIPMLAGCGGYSLPTTGGYTRLCQDYVGHDVGDLTYDWGYGGKTIRAPDGNKVYVYVEMKDPFAINPLDHPALIVYPMPIGYEGADKDVMGRFYTGMGYCITYFEIDKSSKILRVIWEGDCKAKDKSSEDVK